MSEDIEFTRVETGDLSQIPPDAPEGEWVAAFKAKITATNDKGDGKRYPMIILEAHLTEALTPGNEGYVGSKVADFICFFPRGHHGQKMATQRLHTICKGLRIDIPRFPDGIQRGSDLRAFADELEANQGRVWTSHKKEKSGELRTLLHFEQPKGFRGEFGHDDDAASFTADDDRPAKKKGKRAA